MHSLTQTYTAGELKEFEMLVRQKTELAREALDISRASLGAAATNGTDDTYLAPTHLGDGSRSEEREELMMLIIRQQQFIRQLEQALVRIRQGTYGICRLTGKLIPKERLRAVPHATTCLDAKEEENRRAAERPQWQQGDRDKKQAESGF